MIILKPILERGCLEHADFKALIQSLLKIQEEATRKHEGNVWRALLRAIGLHM